MNLFILLSLNLLTLITITNGLSCVSCIGSTNSGCNDPYNSNISGSIPVSYNNYCAKVVYSNYVERMVGGRSCTPGIGIGGSTIYCCSDKDYCNGATRYTSSILITMGLMIMKRIIVH